METADPCQPRRGTPARAIQAERPPFKPARQAVETLQMFTAVLNQQASLRHVSVHPLQGERKHPRLVSRGLEFCAWPWDSVQLGGSALSVPGPQLAGTGGSALCCAGSSAGT
ncbi:hypothetical protein NDU88_003746 [Pleurodeles waltl]|uniref:Uncharacterized protein n=1 Tax=Pleurodeles waltl TaxID=8319 RepID=A0AAV7TQK9_PLEWA|nr:hypothetical protein NDU88_003746 [Pleurodeles waltl]